MLIQNDPIDADAILKLALASAAYERIARIGKWVASGDIVVDREDPNPAYVTLLCDDLTFTEEGQIFPSVKLVADIALAIQAGYSHRNHHGSRMGPEFYIIRDNTWELIAEAAGARVTATVRPVFQGGLQP